MNEIILTTILILYGAAAPPGKSIEGKPNRLQITRVKSGLLIYEYDSICQVFEIANKITSS